MRRRRADSGWTRKLHSAASVDVKTDDGSVLSNARVIRSDMTTPRRNSSRR